MADQHGRVWASVPGLANRARVPIEDAQKALDAFLSPDPYSRTPDNEGRRIEPIDGGWRLLNHEKYRSIRDEESIKESKRNYINARRAREREDVEKSRTQSNSVDSGRANAEADTEADVKEAKASLSATQLQTGETQPDLLGESPANGSKVPPCPMDRLIDAYETEMPMLAQVRRSLFKDSKRAAAMRQRWAWVMTAKHERGERAGSKLATTVDDGVEWFRKFFAYAAQSDFLTGRNGKWNGCNIGFLMSKEKFEKVLEGGYMNNEAVQ